MEINLKLLVLRCANIDKAKQFYQILGFNFVKEKYGKGVEHYAAENNGFVLELYPLALNQSADNSRLGFIVDDIFTLSKKLKAYSAMSIVHDIKESQRGVIMLIQDPDGRKIEISSY